MDDRETGKKDIFISLEMNILRLKIINNLIPLRRKNISVLDVGCSFGYFLKMVKHINNDSILHGIDISDDCVKECKVQIPQSVVYKQPCQNRLPFESNSIDLVTSFHVIEHLESEEDMKKVLLEVKRVLKPDGYLFLETPNCNWIGRRKFASMGYEMGV